MTGVGMDANIAFGGEVWSTLFELAFFASDAVSNMTMMQHTRCEDEI